MSDYKFNVGDEVRCKSSAIFSIGGLCTVKGVDGDNVWIKGECGSMFTAKAKQLKIIRSIHDEMEDLISEYAINRTFKSKTESDKFIETSKVFLSLLRIDAHE